MAVKTGYTYDNIEDPYDALMQRGDVPFPNLDLGSSAVNKPYDVGENSLDGKTFNDLTLSNTMQSRSYNPKKQGFMIDGRMGYIECMKLFVGTGGMIGGSLDIPNTTSAESFHVDAYGNSWWGANNANAATAPAIVLNTGDAKFNNVEITGTSTVGGRLATTIGGAIDADGDFVNDLINARFDTESQEILAEFTFQSVGAIAMAIDANNGIWLSPTGILGKKAGATTFAVTTSGDATFGGSLVAATGTFGTITAGSLTGSLTVGGRLATTIGGAINSSGNFTNDVINPRFTTSTKEILSDFTFGSSGALRMNTDSNNGLWLSPTGILGKKAGATTFSITTSGDATFGGDLVAASGTFGTITAGALQGTLTVGGILATTIGGAFNISGQIIANINNAALNTATADILSAFDFGASNYSGGVYAGNVTWNSSTGVVTGGSGVVLNRAGIAGANAGVATFSISAIDGSAYFKGSIGSGTSISAPAITGGTITGGAITGATIQTAASAPNMILNTNNLTGYDAGPNKRMQLDRDSLEFSNSSAQRTMTIDTSGLTIWYPGSATEITGKMYALTDGQLYFEGIGDMFFRMYNGSITLTSGVGASNGTIFWAQNGVSGSVYALGKITYDTGTSLALFDFSLQPSSRVEANFFAAGYSGYVNFGTTYGSAGFGFRASGGVLQLKNDGGAWVNIPTGTGSGTVTQVNTSGAITGGPITTTGTISHTTGSGYTHIPSGGATNQMLRYSSAGVAQWSTDTYADYFRSNSSTSYYMHYGGSTWDFNAGIYSSLDITAGGNMFCDSITSSLTTGAVQAYRYYNFGIGGQISSSGSRITANIELACSGSFYSTGDIYAGSSAGSLIAGSSTGYVVCRSNYFRPITIQDNFGVNHVVLAVS